MLTLHRVDWSKSTHVRRTQISCFTHITLNSRRPGFFYAEIGDNRVNMNEYSKPINEKNAKSLLDGK